ncbi:MAG: beta-ketoacyl-[acyl-carrier-protein] synthase family protein [Thermodesulfobacteriota bacterium]
MSRVAVTGLGIICCLGQGVNKVWPRLVAGETDFGEISLPGFDQFQNRIGGQVDDDLLAHASSLLPRVSRHERLGWLAASEALADAAFPKDLYLDSQIGVAAGIGAAGMLEAEEWVAQRDDRQKFVPAWKLHSYPASSLADFLAATFRFSGPRFSIATACSSSATSLGFAADAIRKGRAKAFMVAGAEGLSRLTYGGFHSLHSIAPERCQPFDKNRKGIFLGEGAGVLILEDWQEATTRNATIYGEVLSWGLSSDAYHMTAPHPEGRGAVMAMEQALERAALQAKDINYINLHGTGTLHNDLAESKAVQRVFGNYCKDLCVSSTKSMTGHCLGAAGAMESVFSLLALHHSMAPPTAGLETPDGQCPLNYMPGQGKSMPQMKYVMNNVLAFGGNNVALLFGKDEERGHDD